MTAAAQTHPSSRSNLPATETPVFLAREMVKLANITKGCKVLEPSAGYGNIAIAARSAGANVTCVELNEVCVTALRNIGFPTIHTDFLSIEPSPDEFDAVLMCPPFNAIPHVSRAWQYLRPKGKLVALVRRDAEGIEDFFIHYRPLPDNMFSMNGKPTGFLVLG